MRVGGGAPFYLVTILECIVVMPRKLRVRNPGNMRKHIEETTSQVDTTPSIDGSLDNITT